VTLALAFRLRSLLAARGFTVVMTRENDAALRAGAPGAALTLDDRAGTRQPRPPRGLPAAARHGRWPGCSSLQLGAGRQRRRRRQCVPWLTAQAAWVPQSAQLKASLGAALKRAGVPLVSSRASVRPVDSLTCPAVVVELAPEGDDRASINDSDYQQRVAEAIAGALIFWSKQVQPPLRLPAASGRQREGCTEQSAGVQP
jgi:N-acetylmuramoyl-L-alanine amidase